MRPQTVNAQFEIGSWRVDPTANELIGSQGPLRVTPKAMAVLTMLAAERGSVVARTRLCDRVGLSDEGLSRTVSELRKTLEENPRRPFWLQTIPRRGYRLNGTDSTNQGTPPPWTRWLKWPALVVALLAVVSIAIFFVPAKPVDVELRRLTAFEGSATSPRLEENSVVFERFRADGEGLGLWRLDLDSLALDSLRVNPAVRGRLIHQGKIVATMQVQNGRCRIELEADGVDCRDAGGRMDLGPEEIWIAFEDVDGGIARVAADARGLQRLTDPPPGLTDRDPRFSPNGEQLLFVRGDDVRSELYLVSSDGGPVKALTADDQMVFGHDWLNDQRIVFSSDRAGIRELWLLPVIGQPPIALGASWAMGLDANPQRVVFERPVYRADILEIDGSGTRPLIESSRYDNHPRFSPDGEHIVFLSNRTGRASAWIAKADGSEQRLLAEGPNIRMTRPRWLDNSAVVVSAFRNTGSELWRIDLDGSIEILVDHSWSPLEAAGTSEQLWFIGSDDAGAALFLRRADGSIERRHAISARQIEIDHQGRLFVERSDRPGIFEIGSDLSEPIAQPVKSRGWVINGEYLAWAGSRGVLRRRLSDGDEKLLSPMTSDVVGHGMDISADGNRLLLARTTAVQIDLYELKLQ